LAETRLPEGGQNNALVDAVLLGSHGQKGWKRETPKDLSTPGLEIAATEKVSLWELSHGSHEGVESEKLVY